MKNQFSIQYESLTFDDSHSYIFSLCKTDTKDIAISLMKLMYGKIKKIALYNGNRISAELIKRNNIVLSVNEKEISLTENNVELILSFLLDATEEYMAYDHIDLEFFVENKSIDICIAIKQ